MKQNAFWLLILALLNGCSSSPTQRGLASLETTDIKSLTNQLLPFTSDGCPQFPYGVEYPNQSKWALCCVQHDIAYWKGGTSEERQDADKQLRNCIIDQNEPNVAGLVFMGVRHNDTERHVPTRPWGYGWKLNRGYTPLTADDKAQIQNLEKDIPTHYEKIATLPTPPLKMTIKDSLTGNFCIDGVLSFIQHQLHRTLTPMRFEHSLDKSEKGFIETLKINDQLFSEPYEFKFYLHQKSDCTKQPSRRDKPIQLQSFSY